MQAAELESQPSTPAGPEFLDRRLPPDNATSGVRDALRAGVDSIDHPVGLDTELIELWAETDVVYVPTIDHNRYYADHRNEYGYDQEIEGNLRKFVEDNVETLRRAHSAGIRLFALSIPLTAVFITAVFPREFRAATP